MAHNHKIDLIQLEQLLREKKPIKEIATVFGVTPSAVCQAKKNLKGRLVAVTGLEKAAAVTTHQLI